MRSGILRVAPTTARPVAVERRLRQIERLAAILDGLVEQSLLGIEVRVRG
jgi:hypothetical protein